MDVEDLKRRLRASGRTQQELADYLGIDRAEVSKYLSGRHQMLAGRYLKIEAFLAEAERAQPARGVAETASAFAHRPPFRSVTLEEARKIGRGPKLSDEERERIFRELRELGEAGKRLPRITDMTDDEILGYDED
jgi:transcriptional regulator with XRE-family HTH domain